MKQTKDTLKTYFETGDYPTEEQFGHLIDSALGVLDSVSDLPTASADNLGNEYKIGNVYYKCVLSGGNYTWQQSGTVVPSNDYTDIVNKPKINGQTLTELTTVNDIGGIEKDASKYSQAASLNDSDIAYVNVSGTWKKTTIGELRKPKTASVTLAAASWTQNGSLYEQTVSLAEVSSSSTMQCSPSPASMPTNIATPVWLASVGSGTLLFQASNTPSEDVIMNLIYW